MAQIERAGRICAKIIPIGTNHDYHWGVAEPSLVLETWSVFARRGGTFMGGATAFFAVLSSTPACILAVALLAPLAGDEVARLELVRDLRTTFGSNVANAFRHFVEHGASFQQTPLARSLSMAMVVYASTGLFAQLQHALHQLWDIPVRSWTGWRDSAWRQIRQRLVAFFLLVLCGVGLIATILSRTVLAMAERDLDSTLPTSWHLFEHVAALVVLTSLFATLFRLLPEARLAWQDALAGGFVTAVLVSIGRTLTAELLFHKQSGDAGGASHSLLLLLAWIHYSAQMFFLGAAYTAVRARRRGRWPRAEIK